MTPRRPNRREVAAADTRREILRAARALFAEHGFANTSVHQIAEEAGVAVQTVYTSVGSKSALVLALANLIADEADLPTSTSALLEETDPARLIARFVHLTRQLNERCGDLIQILLSAELAEPDAAVAVAEERRRLDDGAGHAAKRLAALGALPASTTPERTAAVLSAMTSPGTWRQLTREAGWTFDETEEFLAEALTKLVLTASA